MRRYTPREMTEILTLAEELRQPSAGNAPDTYSLSEMQSVAGEIGMDPAQIAHAAAQYESGRRKGDKKDRWRHQFVREIPFVVTEAGWERMADEMRSLTGTMGTMRDRADESREWTSIANGETVVLTLTSEGEGSMVNLMVNRTDASRMIRGFGYLVLFGTAVMGFAIASKGGFTGYDTIPVFAMLIAETIALVVNLSSSSKAAEQRFAVLADKLEAAALSRPPQHPVTHRVLEELPAVNELRA